MIRHEWRTQEEEPRENARLLRNCMATAEIIYHMPDHPGLLQSFIWQHMDILPHLPTLRRFLKYWEHNIEGRLHSVRVTSCRLVKPWEVHYADSEYALH